MSATAGDVHGALLLIGPAAIIATVRRPALRRLGQVIIAAAGVISMLLVASTDDAQAGIAFLYAPILGALAAGVVRVVDHLNRT